MLESGVFVLRRDVKDNVRTLWAKKYMQRKRTGGVHTIGAPFFIELSEEGKHLEWT